MKGEIITKDNYPDIYEWLSKNVIVWSNDVGDNNTYYNETHTKLFTIENGKINVDTSVSLKRDIVNIKYPFGIAYNYFWCNNCQNLTSLENCPTLVKGGFNCDNCRNLRTLKGCPTRVDGDFSCGNCVSLTSLQYSPKIVLGHFDCMSCTQLKTLKGCPKKVGGDFDCRNCLNLVKFDTYINVVYDYDYVNTFNCSGCKSLTSLLGSPEMVHDFNCSGCVNLKTLESNTVYVGGDFDCSGCENLTSLKGCPNEILYTFNCSKCTSLVTLDGICDYIGRDLNLYDCVELISLKGMPDVGGEIDLTQCHSLLSLLGLTLKCESLYFSDNNRFYNKPTDKEKYKLYLAMWLELFESIPNWKREMYIKKYKTMDNIYNNEPIIPIEILKEYGF